MFAVTSNDEQQVPITAAPSTSGPNPRPAPVEGPLRITVVSGDATVVQDPATPLSFTVVSGTPGVTTYKVQADADLGSGEVLIEDTVEYTVAAVQASALGFTAGAPEPKGTVVPARRR